LPIEAIVGSSLLLVTALRSMTAVSKFIECFPHRWVKLLDVSIRFWNYFRHRVLVGGKDEVLV
jgi:hypothetical protein